MLLKLCGRKGRREGDGAERGKQGGDKQDGVPGILLQKVQAFIGKTPPLCGKYRPALRASPPHSRSPQQVLHRGTPRLALGTQRLQPRAGHLSEQASSAVAGSCSPARLTG